MLQNNYLLLLVSGSIPRRFGDINPMRVNPHGFPLETENSLNEFYGKPCEVPLVKVTCPWTLHIETGTLEVRQTQ